MSRPKKQTVDFFPHYCNHKKTMYILEQRYSNDGYAFWFKLLEMLGNSEGHYIDLRNEEDREFLAALTRIEWDKCCQILDLLSKLGAIDKELWDLKVVWSDNFIDNIREAYRNRVVEIPMKPVFLLDKTTSNGVSDVRNPQMRVDEMKVDEMKVEEEAPATSETEKGILKILKEIKGYTFTYNKDLEFIRQLSVEFPEIDLLAELKKFKTYKLDKPIRKKSNPRLQVRNWMENALKFKTQKGADRPDYADHDITGKYDAFYN